MWDGRQPTASDCMNSAGWCRSSLLSLPLALLLVAASCTAHPMYDTGPASVSWSVSCPSLSSLPYYASLLALTVPACLLCCYARWTGRKLFTHN